MIGSIPVWGTLNTESMNPKEHINLLVEYNDGIVDMLKDWSQVIMKMTNCDYIILVEKLDVTDINEIIDGVLVRAYMTPSKGFKTEKVDSIEEPSTKVLGIYKSETL